MGDPVIDVMLMLKNQWSLSGNLSTNSITFSTRFYDEESTFPQIVVSPLGGDESPPVDMGSAEATYPDRQLLGVDIWIRFNQDSESDIGWAKNAIYKIRKEAERIMRSGSILDNSDTSNTFLYLDSWDRRDDLLVRPPLLKLFGKVYVIKYVKGS